MERGLEYPAVLLSISSPSMALLSYAALIDFFFRMAFLRLGDCFGIVASFGKCSPRHIDVNKRVTNCS